MDPHFSPLGAAQSYPQPHGLKQDTPSRSLGRSWIQAELLGGRCCSWALGEAPAPGPAQPVTHIPSLRREPGQEIWVVLKYLLMGHHLIPGVSGMSGRLCNLLGRGHLRELQPAARSGSQGPSPVLLPPTHPVHLLGTAGYTGKGHDGVGGVINGMLNTGCSRERCFGGDGCSAWAPQYLELDTESCTALLSTPLSPSDEHCRHSQPQTWGS